MEFSRVLTFAALGISLLGCDRAATVTTQPVDVVEVTAQPPSHAAPSLDDIRTAHEFAVVEEGTSCTTDLDCLSPLRCIDAGCLWPDSMTGTVAEGMPYVEFEGTRLESTRYYLEVADETHELTRGLMHRFSMVEDMGMIFIFGSESPRSFWMRNTYLPLDMVFVTSGGVVDSFVENAEPRTDSPRRSAGPALFVIELNAGEVARMGLQAGTSVVLEGLAPEVSP